jgi:16S rRNA (cytosine967-C5)-methyltransferase
VRAAGRGREGRCERKPPPSSLLDLTAQLLREVLRFDASADAVVSAFLRSHPQLGPRERRVLAETTFAVLRRKLLLRHLAQSGSGTLERRLAALGWAGDEAALRAALDANEQRWLDAVRVIDIAALPDKLRHNLPDWVAQPLRARLGETEFWSLVHSLDAPAPLDLRVNTLKASRESVLAALGEGGVAAQPTPWSPWGLRVQGKPALQRWPMSTSGQVEVQDEGSQLLALLIDAKRGEMVVDFCAGSGGKTLALGAAMRNTGRLYAFDTSGHRLAALKPRLARSGLSNVYAAQLTHERDDRVKRLAGKIDRVLVDAPCSGLGTLRRNPDLKWRQSPESVHELQSRQQAILDSAARLLKPGGRLVYATCSLLAAENEVVAEAFLRRHPEFEAVPAAQALSAAHVPDAQRLIDGPYLRLWPHRHATDGFFAAVWRRRSS